MGTFRVAMDECGRLYVVTREPQGTLYWEPLPLSPGGMTMHRPVDALATPIACPDWAVDFYVLFASEARELAATY